MRIKSKYTGEYRTNTGNRIIPITKDGYTVKIRETPGYDKTRWTISWKEKGIARRATGTDLAYAITLANGVIRRFFDGDINKHRSMVGKDAKAWEQCEHLLEGSGYTVLTAIQTFAKNLEKLNGEASITEAVDSYRLNSFDQLKTITITEALELFLDEKADDVSTKELQLYTAQLTDFAHHFDCAPSKITENDVRTYIESLTIKIHHIGKGKVGDPLGNQTRKNTLKRIVTFYNWMQENSYLPPNKQTAPAKLSAKIKRRNNRIWKDQEKPVAVFKVKQAKRIINECDPDLLAYAAISLFAGMRSSEVLNLEWRDIDFKRGYIEYRRYKSKTLKNRWIKMRKNLISILEPLKGTYPKSRRKESQKICNSNSPKRLSENVRDLGIVKVWPENIARHSYASYRLSMIKDINKVALELGDSAEVCKNNYRKPLLEEEGTAYFSIGL